VQRGLTASEADKTRIDKLASELERVNPNKASLQSDQINGKWKLVYTTSKSILGTTRPPFLRPWGPIFQYIGTSHSCLPNALLACLEKAA
jgi:hypothetical protein